ncbi:hypothetical protein [Desulfofundulus salinus]|uniref:Methyl-accepting chemotaxis protein n=1 Tax=Desulfofundulus salinus TaxID=2419843 RepID=A0A494X463_9FIRM|nr:hypothetical protein [Desulfofundulus salinum]RKO67987.1 hypothetical protein D7024_14265 [Desulfofundulus salinum]
MRTNLREIVGQVVQTSKQVADSASQLAAQAEQTAAGAKGQELRYFTIPHNRKDMELLKERLLINFGAV